MKTTQQATNRNPDGTFPKGVSGNPGGRVKGMSLKEYWRQRFKEMTEEEKLEFSKKVAPELLFRMAEGNPHATSDVTTGGEALQTLLVKIVNAKDDEDTDGV